MTTLKLTVEFTYDELLMHEDDEEGISWFHNSILKEEGISPSLALFSGEIGDHIGDIKVLEIST